MAETAAASFLKVIFQQLTNEALNKYVRSKGIHSELNELAITLSHIQALLKDASHKEITDESVGLWLNSLHQLAYDIDDVLDDVAIEAMHHELTQESGALTCKVRKLIPTCCTKLSLSHRLHHKLDSITNQLQHLERQKVDLGLIVKDEKKKNNNRGKETSFLESNVVGREGENEKLLNKLLRDEPSKENFSILPIVGMGGVGKTTLARLLYNDIHVKGHFELKAWVCVSDDFDVVKISDTILQSVTRENKKFKDLNQLQMALIEQFKDKRFLLVLDDVWTENYDDWENLVRPFNFGAPQSRIIMTTRKEQLLKKLGFGHLDHLECLSHEDALSLFALHALGVNNFDAYPTLRLQGQGIVKKCGRLPLALKVTGRLLRTKANTEEWDGVLNSEIWDFENADEIIPALRLSYHDLSADLKRLFAYCSLFPKNFLFDKEELVLLWMAEGYLNQSPTNKSPECLGHEYFEKLLSRSFFQHAPDDESLFVMHDLMNDFATFVSRDYTLRLDKQMEMTDEALAKCRHISFICENYVSYHKFEAFKRSIISLRTFLAVCVGVDTSWNFFYLSNKILVHLLPELPLLRVLCLSHFKISEVPDFIGCLKHLRYLNLSRTEIRELPDSVGNLCNLQTLIVFGCSSLTNLPKSFLRLKKLRHFDIRDTPLLKKLPLGIGELKNLQTLTKIIIDGGVSFKITELKGLKNLHGEIFIEGLHKVQSAMHAREANLSLKGLTKLVLLGGYQFYDYQRSKLEMDVLNELKPRSDKLKELAIVSYGGIEFPNWVGDPSFCQLVDVSIHNCQHCISLPPLGNLLSLEKLFIRGMNNVKVIGSDLTGTTCVAFPSLKILSFKQMLGWEVWSTNGNALDAVFPCLQELHVKNCPKLIDISLKALPLLKYLEIEECGDGVLRSLVGAASSITKMEIRSISRLTYEVWRGVIENLGTVEVVSMRNCNEIRYLWESEAEAGKVFVNLKKLYLYGCDNLVRLGEKEEDNFGSKLLPSLRMLEILSCRSMKCCCCPNNIESLRISSCSSVTHVSFPTKTGGQKLKSLHLYDCNKLMEKINNTNMPMLETIFISGWTNIKSVVQFSNSIHLTQLNIKGCQNLESFPDLRLPNLSHMMIAFCQRLESLPDLHLPNLTQLIIAYCQNLESFPDLLLLSLTSLKHLVVRNCPTLDANFPGGHWPTKLSVLKIGGLRKPITEWGPHNFPTSHVELHLFGEHVSNFSRLSYLLPSSLAKLQIRELDNLESLSMGLRHLTSLQHLVIGQCPKVIYLPETLLPSLLSLEIFGCPKLKERCDGRGSHYWPLISHIPRIHIVNSCWFAFPDSDDFGWELLKAWSS